MFDRLRTTLRDRQTAAVAAAAQRRADQSASAAAHAYEQRRAAWQHQRDAAAYLYDFAQHVAERGDAGDLMTHAGEVVVGRVSGASLIEDRATGGHYVGGSTGVSIPVGSIAGHSVRYRVGAVRGHYVAGTPTPTAVDAGTLYVTDQRLVFVGAKSTKEVRFDKLVSLHHDDQGTYVLAVSNRQRNVTVHVGAGVAATTQFWVDLALARFRGQSDAFVGQLKSDLDAIDAAKPAAPAA